MTQLNLRTLVLRYSAFAVLATLANLGTQRIVLGDEHGSLNYALAVGAGTLVGLVVKYILDKRWIFFDADTDVRAHGKKFTLYTAMGVLTTAIFWGSETVFWLIWQTDSMRELGAILGLTAGYVIKYRLDRRFVFSRNPL